jgi:hypothetical protein
VRRPRSDHRVRRWVLGFVLTLLTLAPLFLCQAGSSSVPAATLSTQVMTADCDGAHDMLCSRGAAVAVGASTRSGRDGEPELVVVAALVGAALIGSIRRFPRTLPWTPRPVTGRQQLLSLGIARI